MRTHPNSQKKFCKNGHPFKDENLYIWKENGSRRCKICQNNYSIKSYHNKQEKLKALKEKPILVLSCNKEDRIEYDLWKSLRKRCRDPKAKGYKYYGGKGIGYSPSWDSFEQFLFDMGPRPSMNHTVDRIDNSKGYSKENCRWATRKEQTENRRLNYECLRGHPWTEETTLWFRSKNKKRRRCRICYDARIKRNKPTEQEG